ncbi:lipopolysaccharide heptosyltransferase I [Eionea flava]
MRVLIIKLTSMGDLMHAFPALTDAVKHIPNISFDWVVDESFAEVPQWHPAVNHVFTTAHRRWRKNILQSWRTGELSKFYQQLNQNQYDIVVDLQSNLKSACVSWLRKSDVHGYDRDSCRERPAHWVYKKRYAISLRQHAIERQRELFSKIFNYSTPKKMHNFVCDYGVDLAQYDLPTANVEVPNRYVVFVHNASWPTKLWPVEHWRELIKLASEQGVSVLLPCGSDTEYQRAQEIAHQLSGAVALPKISLNDMAAIMSRAQAAVCSDTGLAHMAAVASTPAITLYAVTETLLIGTSGNCQQHIEAQNSERAATMQDITVDQVWRQLQPLLKQCRFSNTA